jgi:hypothetical protein
MVGGIVDGAGDGILRLDARHAVADDGNPCSGPARWCWHRANRSFLSGPDRLG